MQTKPFPNRRAFLRGTGGALVALPFLESIASAQPNGDVPMRMLCVGNNFGFVPNLFFPSETGTDYAMPELLEPMAAYRDQFTIFSQLDHGSEGVGGHGGVHAYLSGILAKNSKGFAEANVSVDQKAAKQIGTETRYSSMQFAFESSTGNQLSWSESGIAIPPVQELTQIFALLFQATPDGEVNVLKRAAERRISILDLVRTDAERLQSRVSRADKEQLDQYFTSIRELEQRLTQSQAWLDKPKPKVDYTLPEGADDLDFVDRLPLYYDLIALALQTDSTRVITLEVSGLGANSGGLPLTKGYHQLTHHGKVESYIDELKIIEKVHTSAFAYFLKKASEIQEANGRSLLDNTMALFGSGMGNASSHSNKDLPLVLAGGGFKHGQHLRFEKDRARGIQTPACNLFVSMLQRFGLEADRFNTSTGTLTGLEIA